MKKLLFVLMFVLAFALAFSASTVFANPSADITLAWDANTETDLVGYKLYQSNVSVSTLDTNNDGIITLNELLAGTGTVVKNIPAGTEISTIQAHNGTWFWVLTAYDAEDNESNPSNEVMAKIDMVAPDAPSGLTITIIIKIEQ